MRETLKEKQKMLKNFKTVDKHAKDTSLMDATQNKHIAVLKIQHNKKVKTPLKSVSPLKINRLAPIHSIVLEQKNIELPITGVN